MVVVVVVCHFKRWDSPHNVLLCSFVSIYIYNVFLKLLQEGNTKNSTFDFLRERVFDFLHEKVGKVVKANSGSFSFTFTMIFCCP